MKFLSRLSLFSVITLTLFLASTSKAFVPNPQIRACHQTGGDFIVAKTENFTPSDQVGFCKYDSALIASLDLLAFQDNMRPVQSLQTYIDGIQVCEPYGQTTSFDILQGPRIGVCQFADGSLIEFETLKLGRDALENSKLNKALGL